jgi:hypothetical protein
MLSVKYESKFIRNACGKIFPQNVLLQLNLSKMQEVTEILESFKCYKFLSDTDSKNLSVSQNSPNNQSNFFSSYFILVPIVRRRNN